MAARSPVPVQLTNTGDAGDLSDELQAAFWFICAEALTNVARHSGAAAVELDIRVLDGRAEIAIRDDGRGGATLERGLRGLSDRVEAQAEGCRWTVPWAAPPCCARNCRAPSDDASGSDPAPVAHSRRRRVSIARVKQGET
jgi:hypothetical protein